MGDCATDSESAGAAVCRRRAGRSELARQVVSGARAESRTWCSPDSLHRLRCRLGRMGERESDQKAGNVELMVNALTNCEAQTMRLLPAFHQPTASAHSACNPSSDLRIVVMRGHFSPFVRLRPGASATAAFSDRVPGTGRCL